MIKLLLSLFFLGTAYGAQNVYLFPDQKNDFMHRFAENLRRSEGPVLVLTPSLNAPEFKKSLLKKVRSGTPIELVVSCPDGDPVSIVQYAQVDLFVYSARPMNGSVVVFDDRHACILALPLDEARMGDEASIGRCTEDPSEIVALKNRFLLVKKRSVPYLK